MQKQIIQIFLDLLMEKGWAATTIEDVAKALSASPQDIAVLLPSKERGFHLLASYIEKQIFDQLIKEDICTYSEKERAMEVLLVKLEVMTEFKPFLNYVRANFLSATEMSLPFAMAELSSLERILSHYEFTQTSLLAELKRKGLFGIYLLTMDTWLKDETADLSPTLAKLDNLLSKGEMFLERYS
jgi:AcrR family transcriptional regulator